MNTQHFDEQSDISIEDFHNIAMTGNTDILEELYFTNKGQEDTIILDVRSPKEIENCDLSQMLKEKSLIKQLQIPISKLEHMNMDMLKNTFDIKENQTLICLCNKGNSSKSAFKRLSTLGYDTFSVFGGAKQYFRKLGKLALKK